jgi:uncharacterized metal-binding protein
MSSGRTHDKITLICLPIVGGISLGLTHNAESTLWIGGSFLFGGLMFGPDLDIRSNQSSRWGWFRWIWLPYRRAIPHRSIFSHGPIVGTFFRLLYITLWVVVGAMLYLILQHVWGWQTWNGKQIWRSMQPAIILLSPKLLVIFVGLEIGAMSHYLADFFSSGGKKIFKPRKKPGSSKKSRSSRV